MSSLIFIAVIIAAMWAPHCTGLIVTRVRYAYRQHTGYLPTDGGLKS